MNESSCGIHPRDNSLRMPIITKVGQFISGDLWAGAEAMVYSLLKGLRIYNDLEMIAILLNEGRLSDEIRKLKIPLVILNEKKIDNYKIIKKLNCIISDKSLDIIHSHRYKENILSYISSRCIKKGVNLMSTQHGIPELYNNNRNIKYFLLNRLNFYVLLWRFQAVVAVSDDINTIMKNKYGFTNNNIYTIHNGIDNVVYRRDSKENDYFIVGSMGRIYPVKNFPLMVEIAKETLKYSDKIRFELAGDGPEGENILQLVEKYNLGGLFRIKGFIKNTSDFYNQLDVYLNTSFHEGFPMGLLEAMAHGLPIIAPNVGGIKEIMENGVHGFVIDGHDPKIYAEKIYSLYINRSLKNIMADAARERVNSHFTIEHMANEYHRLYNIFGTS